MNLRYLRPPILTKKRETSRRHFVWVSLVCCLPFLLFVACARFPAGASGSPETNDEQIVVAAPSETPLPNGPVPVISITESATLAPLSTLQITLAPTPILTPVPTATTDAYADLAIEVLAARSYGGGWLEIVDTLETNESFARYMIKYPSDGLDIYGFMNVPHEGSKFPVAILLHGYVNPNEYDLVPYTRRYADALAEAGFFVIHPNFRNYPPSDSGPDPYRIGYAIDVLNLIAIIREQSQDPEGHLRRADADDINLWGHSMGGGVALRVIAVNDSPYIRTALLYGSMSGDEVKNYTRIRGWTNDQIGEFELAAGPESFQAISPIYHLDRLTAAVAVHHSHVDEVVPVEWSQELCEELAGLHASGQLPHPPSCYFYDAQPHTFRGQGDTLFIQRTIEFFNSH
ncbi:MAG: alpha/beta fold hydrolase [Chloroflexota bacterium]|jgi:uncharacterized protein